MQYATYPNKRINYGTLFGCCYAPSQGYDTHFIPTDGSGSSPSRDWVTGAVHANTGQAGTSNLQAYMSANGWGIELGPTSYELRNPNVTSVGTGRTIVQDFVYTYVTNLMDVLNIPWWLEISMATSDESVFSYSTQPSAYETALGSFFDYIEANANKNFQGYSFEIAFQNCVTWLRNRTSYSISNKDWSGFEHSTSNTNNVNVLQYMDGSGHTYTATPSQRIALLDELIIELFDANFLTWWEESLPALITPYPNLKIVINVDQVCQLEGWSGTPLAGSAVDNGASTWWNCGSPTNCASEEACCVSRVNAIKTLIGKSYDGMVYNFYQSAYPESGAGVPDVQWFIQWADNNIASMLIGSGASWTETTVPHCTTASSVPIVNRSGSVSWTEATVPTSTTTSSVPTKVLSSNITLTTVPHCTTASSVPSAIAKSAHLTQTVVPTASAAAGPRPDVQETQPVPPVIKILRAGTD